MRVTRSEASDTYLQRVHRWKERGLRVVFTNGCFDLFHQGHLSILRFAADLGDRLIVGVNSDASVRLLKGPPRPILPEGFRAELVSNLRLVHLVVIFDGETPIELIREVHPHVLVKGSQYRFSEVAGAEYADQVALAPMLQGVSTTDIVKRLGELHAARHSVVSS